MHTDSDSEREPDAQSSKRKHSAKSAPSAKKSKTESKGKKNDPISQLKTHVSSLLILLPSSFPSVVLQDKDLATPIALELKERRERAEFRLTQLRGHLITSFRRKQAKSKAGGQKLSTRAQSAIKRKQREINRAAALYTQARRAMLKLGMDKSDKHFRPLVHEDLRAYDTTSLEDILIKHASKTTIQADREAQRAVLGQHHVSWIWENWSFIQSGDLGENVRTYFREGLGLSCPYTVFLTSSQCAKFTGSARVPSSVGTRKRLLC